MVNMQISGSTQVYGIVGFPVTHSLSPLFQQFFIKESTMDACYIPFSVKPESLKQSLKGLCASGVAGLNITIPHKKYAFDVSKPDVIAQTIGAVNTLKNTGDEWLSCNTDHVGVAATLQGLQSDLADVLLLGAGGTAYAIVHALAGLGCKRLTIVNRTRSRAEDLQHHIGVHYPALDCAVIDWQQNSVGAASDQATTCIHCTSIGLHGDDSFPFLLTGKGTAMDAVYRPDGDTAFCRAVKKTRRCTDGLPMLIAQGAASFAWWHDCATPDCMPCMQWLEQRLARPATVLSGWVQ